MRRTHPAWDGPSPRLPRSFSWLRFLLEGRKPIEDLSIGVEEQVLAAAAARLRIFPYLVQAGGTLAERHVADAGRLLRPGGSLVILNFGHRGIGRDQADLNSMAERYDFALLRNGTRELAIWDAHAFWLRRGAEAGSARS